MNNDNLRKEIEFRKSFCKLNEDEFNLLMSGCRLKKIQPQRWIFDQGDKLDKIYFLLEGHIKMFSIDENGKFDSLKFISANSFFPMEGITISGEQKQNAVAVEESLVAIIDLKILKKLMKSNFNFLYSFFNQMELENNRISQILKYNSCTSANRRVRQALNFIREEHSTSKNYVPFKILIKDIAALSGTTIETTGFVIKELIRENVISYNKKRIKFLNGKQKIEERN